MKPLIAAKVDNEQLLRFARARYGAGIELERAAWMGRRRIPIVSGGGEIALRKWQAALESTRGADLAATRKVYGMGHMTKDLPIIFPSDQEERGTFVANYRSQTGLIKAASDIAGVVTYEDLAWWLQLALKGGVTGVLSNTSVYTYTFAPTQTSDDLKSATIEWGDDTQAFEGHFGMVDTFEITGVLGEQLRFRAKLVQDDMAPTTFTGALSDRVTEDALFHLTKLALGAIGSQPSSYMSGRFIGMKLTIDNGLRPKFFADGATAKFTGMGRRKRMYSLEVTFEGNAATVTERGVWEAGTPRVGRVTATGTNIAASSPTTAKSIDITLPGIWTAFPVGERETNTTFVGVLTQQYDATLAYDIQAAVANALVTLP